MFTKTIFKPAIIIDTDLLKEGTKIYYKEMNNLYMSDDEGEGVINFSCEDHIELTYDGYHMNTVRTITAEELNNNYGGFIELRILS